MGFALGFELFFDYIFQCDLMKTHHLPHGEIPTAAVYSVYLCHFIKKCIDVLNV